MRSKMLPLGGWSLIAVAAAVASAVPAQAQFSSGQLTVYNAQRLFVEAPAHRFQYGTGRQMRLNFKAGAFQAPRPRNVLIRMFRLGYGASFPTPLHQADGCFIYHSWVRRYGTTGAVGLIGLDQINVLTVNRGTVTNGRFIVVVEGNTNASEFVRIRQADARRYFDRGLRVEVVAPSNLFRQDQIDRYARSAAQSYQSIDAEARTVRGRTCYTIRTVAIEDGQPAILTVCIDTPGEIATRPGAEL